jgi:hypothetical protein
MQCEPRISKRRKDLATSDTSILRTQPNISIILERDRLQTTKMKLALSICAKELPAAGNYYAKATVDGQLIGQTDV